MNKTIVELCRAARFWQARQLLAYTKESESLYRPIIVDSVLPHSCMVSAWILCAHVKVNSFMPDGTMSEGTFLYEVWTLQELDMRPRLVLEEMVVKKRQLISGSGMKSWASDIDRLTATATTLSVRDRRLLREADLDLVRTWRQFPRLALAAESENDGEQNADENVQVLLPNIER